MAAIDFPSSPTPGQEYPFGDFIYVWDGVKWTTKVIVGTVDGGGGSTTYVSETAPVGADPGSTWFCTANGLTYILYADADSIQWVEANPNYPMVDIGGSGGSQTYVGDVAPAGAAEGSTWYCTTNAITYILLNDGDSVQWVEANPNVPSTVSTGGSGSSTYVSETAPVGAADGSSWYCTGNGITYLLLNDGDSSQWVESNPNMSGGAGFVKKAGDLMTGDLSVQSFGNRYAALQTNANYSRLRFGHPSNSHGYGMVYAYSDGGGDYISLQQYDLDGLFVNEPWTYLPSLNQFEMQNPHSKSVQATAGNALTRKDYVDVNFLNKFTDSFMGDVFTLTTPGSYNIEAAGTTNWPWSSGGTLFIQKHGNYLTRLAMNASDGSLAVGASVGNAAFTWQEVYSTNNPPTALEARVAALEAQIAILTGTPTAKGEV